jgi:hypothetical protein
LRNPRTTIAGAPASRSPYPLLLLVASLLIASLPFVRDGRGADQS